MTSFHSLEQTIEQLCAKVAGNADSWVLLRQTFYQKYRPSGTKTVDFEQFELDFLASQNQRGVFNPVTANPPGSLWWQNLNLKLLYDSQLASAVYESDLSVKTIPSDTMPCEIKKWLKFIKKPTVKHWYRAFNASVMNAANLYRADAAQEDEAEQLYINTVLYRLMCAQAMEEDAHIFGETGEKVGKDIRLTADVISFDISSDALGCSLSQNNDEQLAVDVQSQGELTAQIEERLELVDAAFLGSHNTREAHREDALTPSSELAEQVKTLDVQVILPHLAMLYDRIAKWNDVPFVEHWCQNGRPIYPAI